MSAPYIIAIGAGVMSCALGVAVALGRVGAWADEHAPKAPAPESPRDLTRDDLHAETTWTRPLAEHAAEHAAAEHAVAGAATVQVRAEALVEGMVTDDGQEIIAVHRDDPDIILYTVAAPWPKDGEEQDDAVDYDATETRLRWRADLVRVFADSISASAPTTGADADACSECGAALDDGEGWDGRCGTCADRHETHVSSELVAGGDGPAL